MESSTGREIFNVDLPRTHQIIFSPRDRLLAAYEPYVSYVAKAVCQINYFVNIFKPSHIVGFLKRCNFFKLY